MKLRAFVTLVGSMAVAWALPVCAQQSAMPVVGWLNPQSLAASRQNFAGFRKGLGQVGFVQGKTVKIELRSSDGKRVRLPALADDLVRQGVTVIMAGSPPAALAAKHATSTIPIVFTSGADPVRIGLVASYNRPGGNATGIHIQFSQLVGKRLALLHETVPNATRIAVLVNPTHPADAEPTARNATEAARTLGLEIKVFNAKTIGEIDAAFAALVLWHAGAVLVGPDPFFASRRGQFAALATRHVLLTSVFARHLVEAGGLMSYGPHNPDNYRQAGRYVGRILKGERPADLPVQQPTKFELTINLKTAKSLGIIFPASILLPADEVIE
jgi:putative ABC transport system substrate-binding protein